MGAIFGDLPEVPDTQSDEGDHPGRDRQGDPSRDPTARGSGQPVSSVVARHTWGDSEDGGGPVRYAAAVAPRQSAAGAGGGVQTQPKPPQTPNPAKPTPSAVKPTRTTNPPPKPSPHPRKNRPRGPNLRFLKSGGFQFGTYVVHLDFPTEAVFADHYDDQRSV